MISETIAVYKEKKIQYEKIVSIEEIHGNFETYTLISKSNNKLFFIANKVFVSIEQ